MMVKSNLLPLLASLYLLLLMDGCHVLGSKYSKHANADNVVSKEPKPKKPFPGGVPKDRLQEKHPFRTQKVNLVWEKAKKRIPQSELDNLFVDLRIHDKLELETKKHRASDMDKDGAMQAVTRQKLIEILKKYGLHDTILGGEDTNASHNEILKEKHRDSPKENSHKMDHMMDQRVKRLWEKAQSAGLSETELEQLRIELDHHRQRMDEFKQLRNEVDVIGDISDNSIEGQERGDSKEVYKKRAGEMKDKHRDMLDNFMKLEDLTNKKIAGESDFSELRVIKLWKYAQEAGFEEDELASIKEELSHYEHKLIKMQTMEDNVGMMRARQGKRNDIPLDINERYNEKLQHHQQRVEKLDRHLAQKISKQMGVAHGEL